VCSPRFTEQGGAIRHHAQLAPKPGAASKFKFVRVTMLNWRRSERSGAGRGGLSTWHDQEFPDRAGICI
jgi:hypothetical protein